MVLRRSSTKATRKMIDNGVAGRNMVSEQWSVYYGCIKRGYAVGEDEGPSGVWQASEPVAAAMVLDDGGQSRLLRVRCVVSRCGVRVAQSR